jgi:hypothetical protein
VPVRVYELQELPDALQIEDHSHLILLATRSDAVRVPATVGGLYLVRCVAAPADGVGGLLRPTATRTDGCAHGTTPLNSEPNVACEISPVAV